MTAQPALPQPVSCGSMTFAVVMAAVMGALALALVAPCAEAQPAGPVDLYLTEEDVVILVEGFPSSHAVPGETIVINVTIHDAIGGNFSGATVSFFDNDAYLGNIPASGIPGGPGTRSCFARLILDTTAMAGGVHAMRVEVKAENDINASNNVAGTNLTIYDRPSLRVRFLQASAEVAVDNAAHVTAVISGSVEVQSPEPGELIVDVLASAGLGWVSVCSPNYIRYYFDGGGPGWIAGNFMVHTVVPGDARADVPCNLTVHANILGKGGTYEASGNFTLKVKPYDSLVISTTRSYQQIGQKETAIVPVRVHNAGNRACNCTLGVKNIEDLESDGWKISVSNRSLEALAPGESRMVNITARSPEQFSLYVSKPSLLIVNVSSAGDGNRTAAGAEYGIVIYRHGPAGPVCFALSLIMIALVTVMMYYFYKGWTDRVAKGQSGGKDAGMPPSKAPQLAANKGPGPVKDKKPGDR